MNETLAPAAQQLRQMVRSRNDVIFEIVRERICLHEYEEGHVIHEAALATEFRVSRTPIRQVLQRLVYEQLAETRNGVGSIVSYVGDQYRDMLRFRVGLTGLIADLLPLQLSADHRSEFARVLALANALGDDAPVKAIWSVWRAHHEARNALIADEALRQMDDIIFYRVARSWVSWLRRDSAAILALLRDEVAEAAELAATLPAGALFRLHAAHLERLLTRYDDSSSR
jgi:DNA-binding GntR family transcriptional regulator